MFQEKFSTGWVKWPFTNIDAKMGPDTVIWFWIILKGPDRLSPYYSRHGMTIPNWIVINLSSVNVNQGERETFEIYYRKQRRKQARLALELSHGTRVMLTITCVLLIGNENFNYNIGSKVIIGLLQGEWTTNVSTLHYYFRLFVIWGRTSACKGAPGSRYQSILTSPHPTHTLVAQLQPSNLLTSSVCAIIL